MVLGVYGRSHDTEIERLWKCYLQHQTVTVEPGSSKASAVRLGRYPVSSQALENGRAWVDRKLAALVLPVSTERRRPNRD